MLAARIVEEDWSRRRTPPTGTPRHPIFVPSLRPILVIHASCTTPLTLIHLNPHLRTDEVAPPRSI